MSKKEYHSPIYDTYLTHSYAPLNDLTEEGIQKASATYIREFAPYFPTDKKAVILEIGCGKGGFLSACQSLGYSHTHGLDISPEQVAFCQQMGIENVVCADGLTYLKETAYQFDLVVMSDVLEHLPKEDVLPTLQAIHMKLKSGGRVLIKVPNMSNPFNIRSRYVDFTHETSFTTESLAQILRVTGFQVEVVRGLYTLHRRWLARFFFDRLLWTAFLLFYRHTMHLTRGVERGKSLLAVGVKSP
ncbi:MAG: class I SAM-dependent methyltransferase [Anaerolineae bacterium]|nr:class I SAM-dependent methyltransferase [Anaerolineae bacterium]